MLRFGDERARDDDADDDDGRRETDDGKYYFLTRRRPSLARRRRKRCVRARIAMRPTRQTLRARGKAGRASRGDERRASRGRGAARVLLFFRASVPSHGRRGARIDARGETR